MVATIRTWNWDVNYAVGGGSFDAQASDAWFRFHAALRGTTGVDVNGSPASAGAWTVVQSSDGTATAGAGDNISSAADIVFASAGSAHSWAVYESPSGFVPGSNRVYLIVDWADTTPFNSASVLLAPSLPTLAGSPLLNRPTHAQSVLLANSTWFTSTTFQPRTFHAWRNGVGEFLAVFSQDGTGIPEAALWLARPDSGETGVVWPFAAFGANNTSTASRGSLGFASVGAPTQWDSFWQDSTPLVAAVNLMSSVHNGSTASWNNGRSNVSIAIPDFPLDMIWNSATEAAYTGRIVDIRATAENVPENETQDGDTDPVRRLTVGEIWVPMRQGVSLTL